MARRIIHLLASTVPLAVLLVIFSSCGVRVGAQESLPCNCISPYFCNVSNDSCVGETEGSTRYLACLVFKEFFADDDTDNPYDDDNPVVVVGAKCLGTGIFDFQINCHERFQVLPQTGNGIPYRTLVTYCCTTPYCNTVEKLEELIATKVDPTDLPPAFRPTTSEPTTPATGSTIATDPATTPTSTTSTSTSTSSSTSSTSSTSSSSSPTPVYAVIIIVSLCLIVLCTLMVIVVVLLFHWYSPHRCMCRTIKGTSITTTTSLPVDTNSYSDPSLNEDSGSGSGLPLLIQRSISGQITLHNLIGKGRFGEVWRGVYKGENVAVKIFHTKEEMSWFHEVEVYQTCLLRHPNILRFIAADNKDVGLQMQLWLITDFCEYGSLFDLLTRQTFNQARALKLCYTAARGIDHLHTEIVGIQAKPAIAHRDLKSRNILVKADYSCCIADLGLSLTQEQMTRAVKEPPRTTVGTKRYLAPEILDESIAAKNFESFKRADIYSFGLVMWEIGRRAECDGHAEEAQLPYFDLIPSDPTLEEVRKLVCVDQRRPSLPNPWNTHETMVGLSKIIRNCWLHEAEARLTSLRIKKSLADLQELLKDGKEQEQF